MHCHKCGQTIHPDHATRMSNFFSDTIGPDTLWFCNQGKSDCFLLYSRLWEMDNELTKAAAQTNRADWQASSPSSQPKPHLQRCTHQREPEHHLLATAQTSSVSPTLCQQDAARGSRHTQRSIHLTRLHASSSQKEVDMKKTHCSICLHSVYVDDDVDVEHVTVVCSQYCSQKEHRLRFMFPEDPRDSKHSENNLLKWVLCWPTYQQWVFLSKPLQLCSYVTIKIERP